jgi:DNA-binding HxlR family transcriptional regulator
VARNVLSERLKRLTEAGVLERVEYQQRPPRSEYRLTEKGRELAIPLIALMHWGDRYLADAAGPPRLTLHRQCGGPLHVGLVCEACATPATAGDLQVVPGPGL